MCIQKLVNAESKKEIIINGSLFFSLAFISVLIGVGIDIEYHGKPAGIYLM